MPEHNQPPDGAPDRPEESVPPVLPWQAAATGSGESPPPIRGQESPPTPPPEPPPEPAEFPKGFWARLDYMLHNPEAILESLRRDMELWRMSKIFFAIALGTAAIYGAIMGGTNLLQASTMETSGKFLMILTSACKVPVLFLLTLGIVLPPIYVANTFVGPRLRFPQVLTVMMASVAVTGIVLASTATVAFFFALTSRSYHFIKVLHVAFFAYSGLTGVRFFRRCIGAVTPLTLRGKLRRLFVPALVLYVFVGLELTWVLRPFIGDPDKQFELFRPRAGNIYESIFDSIGRGFTEKLSGEQPTPVPKDKPVPDDGGDFGPAMVDPGSRRRTGGGF